MQFHSVRLAGFPLPACLLAVLLIFIFFLPVKAQQTLQSTPAHLVQVIDETHGLPTERITDITLGSDGYLYMASIAGLIRTDGTHIDVFNTVTTPGFKTDRIARIFNLPSSKVIKDHIGLLYHFTGEKAIPMINPETGNHINTPIIKPAGAGKYFIFDKENGYLFSEEGIEVISPTLTNYQLWDAELAPDSSIFVLNTDGFYRMQGDSVSRISFPGYYAPDLSYYTHMIRFGNHIRIAGQSRSVCYNTELSEWHDGHSTPDLTEIITIESYPGENESFLLGTAEGFYIEQNGRLSKLLDTGRALYHSAAFRYGDEFYIAAFDGVWHNGIKVFTPESNIIDAEMDAHGGMWLSTARDGVVHLKLNPFYILNDERVTNSYTVDFDKSGNFWSGSFENGLISASGETLQHFHSGNSVLPNNSLRMIAPLKDGSMLISLWGEPPFLYNNGNITQDKSFWPLFGKRTNVTEAFHEDNRGRWWLGTLGGLYLKEEDGYAAYYDKNQKTIRQISRIIPSPYSDDLFFCTVADGLVMLRDNEFHFLSEQIPVAERQIRDVFTASADTMWLASYSGGLQRIVMSENAEPEISRLGTGHGLRETAYHRIIPDTTGGLWISTNNGLLSTSLSALNRAADTGGHITELYWYTGKDGLINTEFNGGSQSTGAVDQIGNIWFTNMSGLVRFNPYRLEKPYIGRDNLQFQYIITENEIYKTKPGESLSIPPGARNLKLRFSHISPGRNYTPEVWYRTSSDKKWVKPENPGFIDLQNLSKGKKKIELSTNPLNEIILADLEFSIQAHWYEKISFQLFILLVIAGLLTAFIRNYRSRIKQHIIFRKEDFGINQVPLAGHLKVGASGNDTPETNGQDDHLDVPDPIKALIDEQFKNPELKTDWLAAKLNMSRSALYREWKKENDLSLNEYIQKVRLEYAVTLLKTEDKTITEIAYLSGFNSQSYFTKVFKKKYGTAPSEYSGEDNSVTPG